MPRDLVITIHKQVDHAIIQLRGRLHLRTVPQIREAAAKSLLDTGRVLIDLSGLRSAEATLVTVFPSALTAAGGWPSARLVLFGANAALRATLNSTRITEIVHLAEDLPSAHGLLEQRPPRVRRHRDLPMHNSAAAAARQFVREACRVWSVPDAVREVAELVSNELVSNAVEHAHSSSRLTVTVTRSAFGVSVRDYDPAPIPCPRPIDLLAHRGRGLHLVAALAQSWGVDEHADGKTIWATLNIEKDGPGRTPPAPANPLY